MNGEEKHFFEIELTKLRTQFDERWMSHDKGANDRAKEYYKKFEKICVKLDDMSIMLSQKPCSVNQERIKNLENENKNTLRWRLSLVGLIVLIVLSAITSILKFNNVFARIKEKTQVHAKEIDKLNGEINDLHGRKRR